MRSLRRLATLGRSHGWLFDTKLVISRDALSAVGFVATTAAITGATPTPPSWDFMQLRHFAKAPKNKNKPAAAAATSTASSTSTTDTIDLAPFQKQMNATIDHLQHELANIRTGRATPGMLDHLKIEAYGEHMPMKAVGTVSVRDAQLLAVTLFDPGLVDAVIAGIAQSPLQLNPRAEGQEVLVPVPPPTTETLHAMVKVCKAEGESAKVSVRHVRKLALDVVKGLGSEDARRRVEKEVQQLTDRIIGEIEEVVEKKQQDIVKHNS